jgi:hypothetical protein
VEEARKREETFSLLMTIDYLCAQITFLRNKTISHEALIRRRAKEEQSAAILCVIRRGRVGGRKKSIKRHCEKSFRCESTTRALAYVSREAKAKARRRSRERETRKSHIAAFATSTHYTNILPIAGCCCCFFPSAAC